MSNSKLKKTTNSIITICFVSFFAFTFIKTIQYRQEKEAKIKAYKGEIIGVTTKFKKCGKNCTELRYYFYVNNNKIIGKIDGHDLNSDVLNKFYKVKYNEKNPEENFLFINEEIKTDSLTLIKSGFKYVKFHIHNMSTNTYEENWKWE